MLFKDGTGKISMMRVIAFPSAIVGMVIALAGAVGMFFDKGTAGTALATGAGMVAAVLGSKAVQSRAEHGQGR